MLKNLLLCALFILSFSCIFRVYGQGTLAVKFINEQTKESIRAIPKKNRPLPETYLSAAYMSKHQQQFKKGASFLLPVDILDRFGRDSLGRRDGQFVMAKKEMDKLLKQAKGRLSYVETELGIPDGAWKGKKIARIDIPKPKKLNIRIPSGNEDGANDLWIPGGQLPNGYLESVVNRIPKGNYTETVIDLQ
jgi:hypothetical protein